MKAGFLGRFQPFHLGHRDVIEEERENYDKFTIVIGSSDRSRTEKNPLTYEERKKLVKACFPEINVIEIEDTEEKPQKSDPETSANKKWAEKFQEKNFDVIISGNDKVKQIIEKHTEIHVERPEMVSENIYSGTEVRRRIRSDAEWRYLVPECCKGELREFLDIIEKTGTQYDFEPGWKRENAFHGTSENQS